MQSQIQEQKQEQKLQQSISQQQLLQAQLVELPIQQLAERIETEMHDNPALESMGEEDALDWHNDAADEAPQEEDYDAQREREERNDALDAALEGIGRDDEDLPVYQGGHSTADDHEEMVYGDTLSFYDQLLEQVGELDLDDQQRYVMEYLIRSLDDDGLLRVSLHAIADELAIYHNIDLTTEQLETILHQLQQLDPPGIGARSLQECLLLQIDRMAQERNSQASATLIGLMHETIANHFDEFTKKHWDKIQQSLGLNDLQAETLMGELRRLNPKPGASMGETVGRSLQQITPDFIVDTQDDGTVTMALNSGDVPHLQVSQSFADLLKTYQSNKDGLSRQMKEALLYTKQKVDAAQSFIDAIQTRRRTLTLTMKAIIHLQHRFFEEGDESLLRPMILKDVAEQTGLDLSTISRVSNAKYVQTRWGTFPLKFFFSDGFVTESGEELSTREIKAALRELIEAEDKRKPMSDDALSDALKQKGYPVARRTVAKYREQMGLPVARLRKN
ncbi:MAG: RNA polymerase factor sigma-54 [Prevotella sp.]|nr:RNA polymerase factor sigma-54 [Prevotella sp.]